MASQSLSALLTSLVDYAGLFPPAGLPMDKAVADYARHKADEHRYGISRFVCPMKRLKEYDAAISKFLTARPPEPNEAPPEAWRVSVLIDGNLEQELEAIERFNQQHEADDSRHHKHAHTAVIDTLEIKIQTPDIIDDAVEVLPDELFPYFELPVDGDFRGFGAALAGTGFGAKLRTGGVKPELIPSPEIIANFLVAMNQSEVPIKFTAGLHHPLRGSFPLTYEPSADKAVMHGFVNVFLAAAMLRECRIDRATVLAILSETSADAFKFDDAGASYKGKPITTAQIQAARENFAICFGSCSFDDPIRDLKQLGWL